MKNQQFLIGKLPNGEYIGERSQKTRELLKLCVNGFNKKDFKSTQYDRNILRRLNNERKIVEDFLDTLPEELAALAIDLGQEFLHIAVTEGNKFGFSFHNGCNEFWFPTRGIAKRTRWEYIEKGWCCSDIFPCGALEVVILEKWCDRTISW
jgi:hypothetical protein